MKKMTRISGLMLVAAVALLFSSCKKEYSSTTGWEYNNAENGGFEVYPFVEQATGPGLVLIEGGTFTFGRVEEDVMYEWGNNARRVTISSFYMDECEISNLDYREYLYWLERVFLPADLTTIVDEARPDENVWREKLAYAEPQVEYYFRYPAYNHYPVVGVNWLQAANYAAWRTDRVNEQILVDMGFIDWNPDPSPELYFSTDAYLVYDSYEMETDNRLTNISTGDYRNVKMEDGILLPRYRLPTEAEWEYAAYALIGNTLNERVLERKLYPWNGHYTRTDDKHYYGDFVANTRRGRGDLMGVAGYLNDASDIPAPVNSYWPNDFGLYNMGGNVAEWVMDVYRQTSHDDVYEFNPFRGNYYETMKLLDDGSGMVEDRDSVGKIPMVPVSDFKNDRRRNYRAADNINYLDGDWASQLESDVWKNNSSDATTTMYPKDNVTRFEYSMVGDHSRVYKGGSWIDPQYYAAPGQRRYLEEDESTKYIGFRCAMARLGTPSGGGTTR